jgi:pyruvate/2-oxoglutarate dehydrogenase complex dihydrolipoamide dehydrogenase (E3) component
VPHSFDILVLGSGEGGKYLACHMAHSGRRTAVVERRWIGGSCPNINCLPSKNELWSAKVADLVHHAAQFGIVTGTTAIDADVADELGRMLADEGIEVLLAAEVLRVQGRSGAGVSLRVRTPRGEQLIDRSDILVATGRTPNTAGIGLEMAGVDLDARGYVTVNDRLETSAPDVWALGECAGSPQFTHVSFDDFRIIQDNLAGGNRSTHDRLIPFCLFTDPPLARVGLNESEARRRRITMRVAPLPMAGGIFPSNPWAAQDRDHTAAVSRRSQGPAWPSPTYTRVAHGAWPRRPDAAVCPCRLRGRLRVHRRA